MTTDLTIQILPTVWGRETCFKFWFEYLTRVISAEILEPFYKIQVPQVDSLQVTLFFCHCSVDLPTLSSLSMTAVSRMCRIPSRIWHYQWHLWCRLLVFGPSFSSSLTLSLSSSLVSQSLPSPSTLYFLPILGKLKIYSQSRDYVILHVKSASTLSWTHPHLIVLPSLLYETSPLHVSIQVEERAQRKKQ